MANALINGCNIWYEMAGSGQAIVFTPGGRSPGSMMRTIADEMCSDYLTVIHDRRNCGASDVIISGDGSDQEIWADDMAEMIRQLNIGPVYLSGWSSGCRMSILTAIRYPELVKGLLLGWVTGGATAAERLAYQYYGQFIEAAEAGGMEAVAATEFFAERIAESPSNRGRLLGMDTGEFISVMSRWSTFFTEGAHLPVIGATEEELGAIKVPTCIVAGNDEVHTLTAAQNLHRLLPQSEFHDPPISVEEWDRLWEGPPEDLARVRAERAAPIFREFLQRVEVAEPVPGN
jgi:pimeloyl-ACP methyl ester carboxylesterase